MISNLPEGLRDTYRYLYGPAGPAWLDALPSLLRELEARWVIRLQDPFPISYNYAAPAVRADGAPVVLKVGFPNPELTSEIAALRAWDGRGAVRLLEADASAGALLLERLLPGAPLSSPAWHGDGGGIADDDHATRAAAEIMRVLWAPAPASGPFPTVAQWAGGLARLRATFDGGTGPFPAGLVERAEGLFADLLASSLPAVLLHGDLHHGNILAAHQSQGRAPWLAIDPKGLVGDPGYEVAALLHNPWPDMGRAEAVRHMLRLAPRRLEILHEMLGLDRERMLAWGLAQSVLSAWWTWEDHHSLAAEMIAFAEGLAGIMDAK
jgi:streptomycin 6-kinase